VGTGDFTLEGWFKWTQSPNADYDGFFDHTTCRLYYANPNTIACSPIGSISFTPTTNVWYFIALVRESGTTSLYIDTAKVGSAADSTSYDFSDLYIGSLYDGTRAFQGIIDNVRISNTAKYSGDPISTPGDFSLPAGTEVLCLVNFEDTGALASGNLLSTGVTGAADPTGAEVLLHYEEIDAPTVGTDLKVYFSMNGGTNWEELATYTRILTGETIYKVYSAYKTGLTARSADNMVCKVSMENNRQIWLIDWAVRWEY